MMAQYHTTLTIVKNLREGLGRGKYHLTQDRHNGIRKVFLDWFLIGHSHFALLTHGSLFGASAVTFGYRDQISAYYISSEDCIPGTYPGCHSPRWPDFCSERPSSAGLSSARTAREEL
eukprot:g49371.t1